MSPVVRYFAVTFGWTWTVWWIAVFAGRAFPGFPVSALFALGGLGPAVGAAFVILSAEPVYRRDFIRRLWDPKRIPSVWWLALGAVAFGPALAGYLGAAAAGRPPLGETPLTFGTLAFVVGFALAAGAVEEPGWRGVARDLLQARNAAAVAALLVGIPWALWHLPLFFLEGTYQHGLGFGSARFWLFNGYLVLLSILYVWLCNGSGGSILIAILAHAGTNIAGSLIPQDTLSDMIGFTATLIAVILLVWRTRGDLHRHARRAAA